MYHTTPPRFRKTLFALAVSTALAPQISQALDLAQSPPGTKEPYVAPNVIISLDDSGSMSATMASSSNCSNTVINGVWASNACRYTILRQSLIDVISDTTLLPDGKIRLAWQTLNNYTSITTGATSEKWAVSLAGASTSSTNKNVMRVLAGAPGTAGSRSDTTRGRFLKYLDNFTPSGNTPTHAMVQRAHKYLTEALHVNGPWASVPGTIGAPYLSCRRNYHILLTDGGWNDSMVNVPNPATVTNAADIPANYDGSSRYLPDGTFYPGNNEPDNAFTRIFRDNDPNSNGTCSTGAGTGTAPTVSSYFKCSTIADWALYSWSTALQNPANMSPAGRTNYNAVQPSKAYRSAPDEEEFGTGASAVKLNRYWNPRYDPATWPHLVTYTIGFSGDAVPKKNYQYNGGINYIDKGTITAPTTILPYGFDGSFADYAKGTYQWNVLSFGVSSNVNSKGLDMWHAAINGRGGFYSVESGDDLKTAFRDIIGNIVTESEPATNSMAASGFNNSRNDVGLFSGGYWPDDAWKGTVIASILGADGNITANWDSAARLDAMNVASRKIMSWSDTWTGSNYKGGVLFQWDSGGGNLSIEQQAKLGLNSNAPGATVATNGANVMNYIRGDKTYEADDATACFAINAAKPFRKRVSRQGDIVNSAVWYTATPVSGYALNGYLQFVKNKANRLPMVYVGGNDGMLHGFSAEDGSEKIAYVPRGVIPSLHLLTLCGYNDAHRYFVDGSPMTGDVDLGGVTGPPDWRTLLVGTLGAGGKGYFVLDVTDPDGGFPNPQTTVRLDRTRSAGEVLLSCAGAEQGACLDTVQEDKDIGNITVPPVVDDNNPLRSTQIVRMNDNRWAVVMGNGYNSANQRPVLLIQYLDGDQKLVRIPVTGNLAGAGMDLSIANDNGLSAPRLVDLNGDGTPDVVYAGDNLGNMWKFDLTSHDPTKWDVAFNKTPLYKAKGPAALGQTPRNIPQPITAPPTVRANNRGANGMMVAFGTGRNITTNDPEYTPTQTLYSVLDNTRYKVVVVQGIGKRLEINTTNPVPHPISANDQLAEQKIVTITTDDKEFATIVPKDANNDLGLNNNWANYKGWFLDFPSVGERLLKSMSFYDGSNILAVYSQVPAMGTNETVSGESCDFVTAGAERQYLTFVNIMDGKRSTIQIVDMNGDGLYNAGDQNASRLRVSPGGNILSTGIKDLGNGNFGCNNQNVGSDGTTTNLNCLPRNPLRPSWRQLR